MAKHAEKPESGGSSGAENALNHAIEMVRRQHGKEAIRKLGDQNDVSQDVSVIPTGSLGLDQALGIGGLPRGRIVEIYGPESSGKTTLALHVAAEAQKLGGTVGVVDAEHALDPSWARTLGCDPAEFVLSQPDTGEQALEIAEKLVRSHALDVLVVDSVAALVPQAELEGEMGDNQPGLQARLMSQALRKLNGSIAQSNTLVIFINQIRMKIGVMMGSPETTTGGNGLKFYASVRLDIRRIGSVKGKDNNPIANQTKVKVAKNKHAPPFREAQFDIRFSEGIDRAAELVDQGVKRNIVEKSGVWFSYNGERLGQGRDQARQTLKKNPEKAQEIEELIREETAEEAVAA